MEGLSLFKKTSGTGCWNIASYHSPHSLTWSWILSFSLPRGDEGRWLSAFRYRDNGGLQWGIQIARCCLRWHRQRPMWYRDLYQRLQDRLHKERYEQPEPPPPQHRLTVIDGGQSLH